MEDKVEENAPGALSRRDFLGALGAGAAMLGAGGILGACGSSSSSTTTSTRSSTQPIRGGTLRIGLTGGASSDTLYPLAQVTPPDLARSPQLFNSLIEFDSAAQLVLSLAEEMVPNSNATEWTIRVKQGITFHNGKPLGADDVLYTLQQCLNPKSPAPTAALLVPLDLAGVKTLDRYTLRIPFKTPYSSFPQMIQNYNMPIMPVGFDLKNPVGTGPFEFVSFTPGVTSTFKRNPNYFETGLPYVDEVVITDYPDETSLTNALLSNEEDAIGAIEIASVPTVANGGQVVVYSNAGGITPFTMRTDVAPFNDVRVRQAMRLIVDRPQMRELVFGGHGLLGNDVTSPFDPAYDSALPQRVQDIGQAKSLLKAAGYEDLTVTLVTSPIEQGTVSAATVFAPQAKAANVNVVLQDDPVSEFYGPNYLKWVFAQDFYFYSPYMLQVTDAFLPTSPYNETHFDNAKYNGLYAQAQAITNQAALTPVEQEMMQMDYDEGGYIIPYFVPVIDSHSPRLQGVLPAQTGAALRNFEFKYFWFSS
jgi:peptide/nickel transport system substrate-binding protein